MKKLRIVFLLLFIITLFLPATAQQARKITIVGRIGEGKEPLPGATVTLRATNDSTLNLSSTTDSNGLFSLTVRPDTYLLTVTFVGYQTYNALVEGWDNVSLPDIQLTADTQNIGEISVIAKRLTFNSKGYTYNVMGEPLFRTDRLTETLAQLPGLTCSNAALMAYQQPILSVFVNEKKLRLPMTDILRMLRSYKSKNIVSVAVLNSTADPEVSHETGFVLKITTKAVQDGGEADFDLLTSMGTRRPFTLYPSATLAHKMGKWSFYFAPEYTHRQTLIDKEQSDILYTSLQQTRYEDLQSDAVTKQNLEGTSSIAYDFSPATSLMASMSVNSFKAENTTTTSNVLSPWGAEGQRGSTCASTGSAHYNQNYFFANWTLDFQTILRKITLNAYAIHASKNQDTENSFSHLSELAGESNAGGSRHDIKFRSHIFGATAAWDFTQAQSVSLDLMYAHWTNNDDALQVPLLSSLEGMPQRAAIPSPKGESEGVYIPLTGDKRGAQYRYKEDTYQASGSYRYAKGRVDFNAGISITHSKLSPQVGQTLAEANNCMNIETTLEPSATLALLVNKKNKQYLTFRYRHYSLRPALSRFNPAVTYTSDYSTTQGSPTLTTSRNDEFSIRTSLAQWTVMAYASLNNSHISVYDVDDKGIIASTLSNGSHYTSVIGTLASPVIKPLSQWMLTLNAHCAWTRQSFAGKAVHACRAGINVTSTCRLPMAMTLRAIGELRTSQRSFYTKTDEPFSFSLSLKKTWLNEALTTSLGAAIKAKRKQTTVTPQFSQLMHEKILPASISLYVSYNLGWGNKYADVKKKTDVNTELLRMKE